MYRNLLQKGFLSIFYSLGSSPLLTWGTKTKNGYMKRIMDEDCESLVLEIVGRNVETCYMTIPASPSCPSLGIKLPILNLLVKNVYKYFSMEIQILDDKNCLRRFRLSNYQKKTRISNFSTHFPMAMTCGWNKMVLDLVEYTQKAYKSNYMETVKVTIYANCRLRCIYFSDRHYTEEEIPNEFRLLKRSERRVEKPRKFSTLIKKFPGYSEEEKVETVRPCSPVGSENPVDLENVINLEQPEDLEVATIPEVLENVKDLLSIGSKAQENPMKDVQSVEHLTDFKNSVELEKSIHLEEKDSMEIPVATENDQNFDDAEKVTDLDDPFDLQSLIQKRDSTIMTGSTRSKTSIYSKHSADIIDSEPLQDLISLEDVPDDLKNSEDQAHEEKVITPVDLKDSDNLEVSKNADESDSARQHVLEKSNDPIDSNKSDDIRGSANLRVSSYYSRK